MLPAPNRKRGTYRLGIPPVKSQIEGSPGPTGVPRRSSHSAARIASGWMFSRPALCIARLSSNTSRRIRLQRVNHIVRGGRGRSKAKEAFSVFRKPVKNLLQTMHLQQHSPSYSGEPGNWNLLLHNPGVMPGGALQSPPDCQTGRGASCRPSFFLGLSPRSENKKEEGGWG